ncbi:MAG: radical SAM protein [Patescibacteria group bacterium]|nr:radical SAM protein [Patescibacteria group bacterium]
MKIVIGYPPLKSNHGIPLLSQNRQFQWFKSPTYIYPVVPAAAATLLQSKGHQVIWLDGIAENWTYNQWFAHLKNAQPDLLFMETKTPVIKQHWRIIKSLKQEEPNLLIVLVGDHVTTLPKETLKNCPVDYIISGGNYDTALLSLINRLVKKENPPRLIKADPHVDLNRLPFIDRQLTKWQLYAYKNGNFKYTPGTYTMAGRDCWWRREGGCTFCTWTALYPQFSVRTPKNLLDEIGQLIKLGVKEVFDDTGTFMPGKWLTKFCQGMIKRGYHKKITLGCNMRFGVLTPADYRLMAKANFRFILYGLESVNPQTLKRLNKGTDPATIEAELQGAKAAAKAINGQLEPHVTCMVGYPWESYQEAQNTVRFTQNLFKKGLIDSLQATICIPYPSTRLFQQAKKNHWLLTFDWNKYDMRQPILKTKIPDAKILKLTRQIYLSCLTPQFILKKLFSIKNLDDLKWFANAGLKVFAHLLDFS